MKTVGTTQFVSISEAKATLPKIVDAVAPTVVLRHNEPVAAVLPIEKYNDLLALEVLIRDNEMMDRLRERVQTARRTPIEELGTMEDLEGLYASLNEK